MEKFNASYSNWSFKNMGWPKSWEPLVCKAHKAIHNTINKQVGEILAILPGLQTNNRSKIVQWSLLLASKTYRIEEIDRECKLDAVRLAYNKEVAAVWDIWDWVE